VQQWSVSFLSWLILSGAVSQGQCRSSRRPCTDNSTREKMCRGAIIPRAQLFITMLRSGPGRTDAPRDRRIAEGNPFHPRNGILTGILSLVTARTAAKPKPAPHIRMK
jgi:hypothetical protein